jgi:hypothetical protein
MASSKYHISLATSGPRHYCIFPFKLQYRKMWIAYMIRQFDKEMDPLKMVTLLEVINWTAEAWNHYVRLSAAGLKTLMEWFDVDGHAERSQCTVCTPETRSATYNREHQQDLIELYN